MFSPPPVTRRGCLVHGLQTQKKIYHITPSGQPGVGEEGMVITAFVMLKRGTGSRHSKHLQCSLSINVNTNVLRNLF